MRYLDVKIHCLCEAQESYVTESSIIYTHTDEAPLLATYSFLPIIEAYAEKAGVSVQTRDISLAARILAELHGAAPRGPAGGR